MESVILKNGHFYSPAGEFNGSVLVNDGEIAEMGEYNQLTTGPDAEVIDLEGKTVLPGFIDSHVHLLQTGFLKTHLDLTQVKSIKELKSIIKKEADNKKPGEWVIGTSFDDTKFVEKRFPTKDDLDEVSPNNPVFITRICTHLMVVNTKAMEIAKINKHTESPQGGKIDRDEDGNPTGILRRNAEDLIFSIIYGDIDLNKKAIKEGIRYFVENGITTVHSMAISVKNPEHYHKITQAYREALSEMGYPLRVFLAAEHNILDSLLERNIEFLSGDNYFKQGFIKFFTDGSYGSRTALFFDPYSDDSSNYGIESMPKETMRKYVIKAHENGYQCAIHALGDKGLSNALDVFEELNDPQNKLRHRIVHAGVINEELLKRIKKNNLGVDIQPNFVAAEVAWIETPLGERVKNVYAWRRMKEAGIRLAASSDSPVEPANPFYGIRSAVLRKNLDGHPSEGFFLEECLSVEEMIELYTRNGAIQYFEENQKGLIEKGKVADFVVLDKNPREIDPENLPEISIEMTIVGGRIVYSR